MVEKRVTKKPRRTAIARAVRTVGDDIIDWIETYCRIPEGRLVGQPVKLTPQQRSWVKMIYDSPTRTFILSMARKNAKTAFSAFLLLVHLVGPMARPNSQLYSAAQSKEQASLLFELAAKIVRMSPDLDAEITVRDTNKEMVCRELGVVYKALSADAKTKFGMSPVFTVHDELGQVVGPRFNLYDALETASGAHDAPLSIIISTQAATDNDLLSLLIDNGMAVHPEGHPEAGKPIDPETKVVLYTAAMDLDPFSEEAIRQANPHFDAFMGKAEVLRQVRKAKGMPAFEASYRNLILNQRVEAKAAFIPRSVWEENSGKPRNERGMEVYGGLDLSSVSDLTSLVLVTEDGDINPTFWLPEEGIEQRSREDRVTYDVWARAGYLETTPGRAIEYQFVAEYLREVFDTYIVRAIGFDRYNMRFLRPWLEKAGFTPEELERFVEFGQGFVSMSPALRELETRALQKKLRHGNHPVMNMCCHNAVAVSDPAGNRKFTKQNAKKRIDGMVGLAMAIGVMPHIGEPEKEYRMLVI